MTGTRTPDLPVAAPVTGSTLTGTATLIRFMLRRDRVRIPAWIAGLAIATVATAFSFVDLYPTEADRQTIAATMETPAMTAMSGVNHGIDDYTFGAMMGHQMLWFTAILAGLMSVLLLVRHTRLEETTGRAELVRAGVVGRHASTTAALAVVAGANVALAVAMALGLGASGIEGITWTGSWLYGAAHAAVGLVFAGVAAITVQVTEHARGASGMAIAAIGLAYVVRAVGDLGEGVVTWLSPIGWAQATQVYVTDRWWPLLLAVAAAAVLIAGAFALSARRDVGAGLRRPRPGRPAASDLLAHPVGFALRLHRASLLGWAVGLLLLGSMYGSVLGEAEQMITEVEALEGMVAQMAGANLTEAFAAMITTVMAIIASIYAVLAALKVRTEETGGRAEPVLSTGLSRMRWVASHLIVALLGGIVVLLAAGFGIGLTGALSTEDPSLLPQLLGAALAYAPAVWVTVGVVAVLFGLLPRASTVAWVVVVYSFITVYLGGILQFPDWMNNLSPFGHVPQLPADEFTLTPLAVLAALAAGLVGIGLATFRRRDLQTPT